MLPSPFVLSMPATPSISSAAALRLPCIRNSSRHEANPPGTAEGPSVGCARAGAGASARPTAAATAAATTREIRPLGRPTAPGFNILHRPMWLEASGGRRGVTPLSVSRPWTSLRGVCPSGKRSRIGEGSASRGVLFPRRTDVPREPLYRDPSTDRAPRRDASLAPQPIRGAGPSFRRVDTCDRVGSMACGMREVNRCLRS